MLERLENFPKKKALEKITALFLLRNPDFYHKVQSSISEKQYSIVQKRKSINTRLLLI